MSDARLPEELDVTAEELEIAQQLSEALEPGGSSRGGADVEELVETAQLVRVSRNMDLDPHRHGEVRAELLGAFEAHHSKQRVRRSSSRWLWWLPLPAAAAGGLLWMQVVSEPPQHLVAVVDVALADEEDMAEAPVRLLEVQARALAEAAGAPAGGAARAELERELEEHRRQLMASLEAKLR